MLAVAVAVAFSPALRAPFIYDDLESIAGNVTIRRLWPLTVPLTSPADVATTGRPVANLSLALNYAANAVAGVDQAPGASDPNQTTGYHFANLLLHLLAGALLFGVVRRTMQAPRLGERWRAIADPVATATGVADDSGARVSVSVRTGSGLVTVHVRRTVTVRVPFLGEMTFRVPVGAEAVMLLEPPSPGVPGDR